MASTATIFFIEEQMLAGADNPWGVRYDAQILPRGSVVVGFMKWKEELPGKGHVQELVDEPYMHPNQEQAWKELLEDARTVLVGISDRVPVQS